jgi:ankyrin repeat protein
VKKVGLLVLIMLGFAQVSSTAEDYSKMLANELDAAFILAVQKKDAEKIQELIQAGANVNTAIPYCWTKGDCDWWIESSALIYAVRSNCPNIIKVLLKVKRKLNESLNDALHEAIREKYSDVVEELIDGGADINCHGSSYEDTPLILAVSYRARDIIQILLKAGAKVDSVNKGGRTALMEAVSENDLNTVLDLLKVPAMSRGSFFGFGSKPINYADKDGNTALILAVKSIRTSYIAGNDRQYIECINSQKIVEELLKFPGIDPHHVNNNGETAITLLEKWQNGPKIW